MSERRAIIATLIMLTAAIIATLANVCNTLATKQAELDARALQILHHAGMLETEDGDRDE